MKWRVRFRVHDGGDLGLQTAVQSVTPAQLGHDWRPVVGGTRNEAGNDRVVLVYQREPGGQPWGGNVADSQVWARVIDTAGAVPTVGAEFRIPTIGGIDQERPAVNRIARRSGDPWAVVWQELDRAVPGDDWDLGAWLVTDAGTLSPYAWSDVDGSDLYHRYGAKVAGSEGSFAVAYVRSPVSAGPIPASGAAGRDLRIQRFRHGMKGYSYNFTPVPLLTSPSPSWRVGGISYDDRTLSHWGLTAIDDDGAGGSGDVRAIRIGYRGAEVENRVLHAGSATDAGACADALFRHAQPNEYGVVYASRHIAPPLSEVRGNRFVYPTAAAPRLEGTSCSGAILEWVTHLDFSPGSQQIGSHFNRLVMLGVPAHTSSAFLFSLGTTNLPLGPLGAPGCRLLVEPAGPTYIGYRGVHTNPFGQARLNLPLPEHLPAGTYYIQGFYLTPGGPNAFASSRRMAIEFVK